MYYVSVKKKARSLLFLKFMIYKCRNAYFFSYLNTIGGVESHLYYLAKKYRDRDWCVVIRKGDPDQIRRLSRYVRIIMIRPFDRLECKRIFLSYDMSILSQTKAEEKYYAIHADYQSQIDNGTMPKGSNVQKEGIKYIAVSKCARDGFKGDNIEVVYMPIELDRYEDPILLMSATRLTAEKGFDRIKKLAKALDDAHVNYMWHIFTNSQKEDISPNVIFMKPRLDIVSKMKLYDGMVQLSDSEAFCITIQEALLSGIHLIATPLPLIKEIKAEKYTITLPFDMENIGEQIEQIRHIKEMPEVKYRIPKEKWDKLLDGECGSYNSDQITVMALGGYQKRFLIDAELGYVPVKGQTWQVSKDRLIAIQSYEREHNVRLVDVL